MTLFKIALSRLGLSQSEAAAFLKVSVNTVKSWSAGRNPVAPGAWDELFELSDRQEHAAQNMMDEWEEAGQPSDVELGLASDNHEAQSLGWPSVGAQLAVFARFWELSGIAATISPRRS